jgi:hypothetical protein
VPIGGFALGIALAFLLAQMRPSVDSRRQLQDLVDYPLLGMVSRVDTDAVRLTKRRTNLILSAATAALVVGYLVQVIYYLFVSQAA